MTSPLHTFSFCIFALLLLPLGGYAQQASPSAPGVSLAAPDVLEELAALPVVAESSEPVILGLPALRNPLPALRYPEKARRFQRQGTVIATFIVTHEGEAREVEILKGFFSACDEEVMRVLRRADFEPAQNTEGLSIDARYVVGFTFEL